MKNLRKIRKAKGLTMKELGEAVGVSESMIGMIETDNRKPSFEVMLKIAEELGCSVDDLVNDKEIPTAQGDGPNDGFILDLSALEEDQIKLIQDILKINPQQRSVLLSVAESYLANQ